MKWAVEPNEFSPQVMEEVLLVDIHEDIGVAYAEFWKRIMSDATAFSDPQKLVTLSFDIVDIQWEEEVEDGSIGYLHASFLDEYNRAVDALSSYYLKSRQFDFFYLPDEAEGSFQTRELQWLLNHYQLLKDSAQAADVKSAIWNLVSKNPIRVKANTANGSFDMQIPEKGFGAMHPKDKALLDGVEPFNRNPLEHLMPGGASMFTLMQELTAALIEYTPPHFKRIHFQFWHSQDHDALITKITCPDFPDETTYKVSERVQAATDALYSTMGPGAVRLKLEEQPDGTWKTNLEKLEKIDQLS